MPAVDTLFSQLRLGKKSKLLSAQTVTSRHADHNGNPSNRKGVLLL